MKKSWVKRMPNIDASQLGDVISKELKAYSDEVTKELDELKEQVVNDGIQELKSSSPRNSGKYAKGWRKTSDGSAVILFNATKPSLTHLLEKGHAKRNGGRVAAQPHIQPVEESIIKKFEDGVERVLGK